MARLNWHFVLARSANAPPLLLPLEPPPKRRRERGLSRGNSVTPSILRHLVTGGGLGRLSHTPETHSFCTLTVPSWFFAAPAAASPACGEASAARATASPYPPSVCVKPPPRRWGWSRQAGEGSCGVREPGAFPRRGIRRGNRQTRPRCWCHLAA